MLLDLSNRVLHFSEIGREACHRVEVQTPLLDAFTRAIGR